MSDITSELVLQETEPIPDVVPDITVPEVTEPEPEVTEPIQDVTEPEPDVLPEVTEPEVAPIPEIIVQEPDPFDFQLQSCTKFALFIGLNYDKEIKESETNDSNAFRCDIVTSYVQETRGNNVASSYALVNRIASIDAAYTEITSKYNYDASNTLVLYEPTNAKIMKILQKLVGYSAHLTEIMVYYAGYGTAQMDKVMISSDNQTIDVMSILNASCCKTMCFLDTCPMEPGIPVRWGADVYGHIKIIVLHESDELCSNKTALIQRMIQSYLHITGQ